MDTAWLLWMTLVSSAPDAQASPKWESSCVAVRSQKAAPARAIQLQTLANEKGAQGWLMSGWSNQGRELVVCFSRPVGGTWPILVPRGPWIDPNAVVDLSGRFNDIDQDLMSGQLASECTSQLRGKNLKTPNLKLTRIRDMTNQQIDLSIMVKQLEQRLASSGLVRIVRKDSPATLVGALSLRGRYEENARERLHVYYATLDLLVARTGEKACIATGKVKKYIEHSDAKARKSVPGSENVAPLESGER